MNQLTEFFHDWNAFHFFIGFVLSILGIKAIYEVVVDAWNVWVNDPNLVSLSATWLANLIEYESNFELDGEDFVSIETSSITGNKCIQIVCEGLFWIDDLKQEIHSGLFVSLHCLTEGSIVSRNGKYLELEAKNNWNKLERELYKLLVQTQDYKLKFN